jgi:hypothetical protein
MIPGAGISLAKSLSGMGYAGLFAEGGFIPPGMWGSVHREEKVYGPATVIPAQSGNVQINVNNSVSGARAKVHEVKTAKGERRFDIQIDEMNAAALDRPNSRSARSAQNAGNLTVR